MPLFPTPDLRADFVARAAGIATVELGCGERKIPGSTGVDIAPGPCVDVVHDLNQLPWPFDNGAFGIASLNHVIEHLEDIPAVFAECARLLRPGGRLWVATPHFSDVSSWTDPTHRYHLGLRSFESFCQGDGAAWCMEIAYVRLNGRWRNFGYEHWINRGHRRNRISDRARRWEDRHCFVRRGGEMCFEFERV